MTSVAANYEAVARTGHVPQPQGYIPARPIIFVIPAYNEADNLPNLLADLESHPRLFTPGSRLIVVDDGSDDESVQLLRRYRGVLPVEVLALPQNAGPGNAFRVGFSDALARCSQDALIVTLEADTTSDLDTLPAMLASADKGADLVLASVHGGGQMLNVALTRRILSAAAGFVVRHALGLDARTVSSFFRVYRAEILRAGFRRYGNDLIQEPGFACKAELLAKLSALGARVEEIPVDLDATRRIGPSKMPIFQTLKGYWRLTVRQRIEKGVEPA